MCMSECSSTPLRHADPKEASVQPMNVEQHIYLVHGTWYTLHTLRGSCSTQSRGLTVQAVREVVVEFEKKTSCVVLF